MKSDRFLIKAAELYYRDGLSQQEIAQKLHTSRTSISRAFIQQIKPRYSRHFQRCIVAFSYIGVARLELAASCSQSRRATNCATPRHPAAQLHRQNIVYRFLCGSSIQKSAADSAARVAFFSWRKRQPTTAEKHTVTGAFKGTGCGFGATAEKRMQKLGRVQNLLHSSCKKAEKVLS